MSKVLIASNNLYIVTFFEESGIPLAKFATADTALAYLEANEVQAVILTEELPDETQGLDLYKALRNQLGLLTTPVILFSDQRHMHVHVAELRKNTDPHISIADSTSDLPTLAKPYKAAAA